MGNAESQSVALAVVPKITSSISISCQAWIIRQVVRDHRRGRGKATSRALLGMGCVDVAASFGWFMSTWAAPAGKVSGVPYASGTVGTCTFQGFLLQLAIGAPFYNCLLSLIYLLTVRYGWSEHRLRRIEYVCHSAILLFAVGTGIALIPLGMYNHIGAVCWVMGSPQGCGNSNYGEARGEPCERGDHAWIYGVSLFYGPLWACILFTTASMSLIYQKVKSTEARSSRHVHSARGRAEDVKVQALLYVVAFYVSWLPSTLWSVMQWRGRPMFALDLLATICEPSQGWMNLLVFIRPRKGLRQKLKRDLLSLVSFGVCRTSNDDDDDDDDHEDIPSSSPVARRMRRRMSVSLMNIRGSDGDIALHNAPTRTEKEAARQPQRNHQVSSVVGIHDSDGEDDNAINANEEHSQEEDWQDQA